MHSVPTRAQSRALSFNIPLAMTTPVVVRNGTGARIAVDSLSHYRSTKKYSDGIAKHNKTLSVGSALLAPTGPASPQLILRSIKRDPERRADFHGLVGIFEILCEFQRVLQEDYSLNLKADEEVSYDSILMKLLIAAPGGTFGVYPSRSVHEYKRSYAFGSGADLTMDAMHASYERCDAVEDIARAGVEASACFDASTSFPMSIHSLDLKS
ncbi:MAG: ATP-dependent HslUV protease subunit HslV [Planctomycetota bacterium]|jgi:ATP-dependent HslUV protease subunit HslV